MSGNAMNIYDFDMLQMYFGRDQYVTDVIGIKQPTIGQIVDYGEQQIYALIAPFIMNPTSCRVKLWDSGIDWNKISEWELFLSTYKTLIEYDTSIVFGDLDFASLKLYRDKNDGVFLFDPDSKVFINETVYTQLKAKQQKNGLLKKNVKSKDWQRQTKTIVVPRYWLQSLQW